ncbi:hypothetical protein KKE92_05005 [Candidatus Micrarchaeota archaeon]|nr:hypothetical protein [Candidatus Micrarchaeota archaeon]MBU1682053.1 hypothetical protein [Candidatus Micrarchaeota archaeon]
MKQQIGQRQTCKGRTTKSRFKDRDIASVMQEEINRGIVRDDHEWVSPATDDGAKNSREISASDVNFRIFDTKLNKEE